MTIKDITTIPSTHEGVTYICIHAERGEGHVFSILEYDIYTRSQLVSQINFEVGYKEHYKETLREIFERINRLEGFVLTIGDYTYTGKFDTEDEPHDYEIRVTTSPTRYILGVEYLFFLKREVDADQVNTKIADWFLARLNQDPPQEK